MVQCAHQQPQLGSVNLTVSNHQTVVRARGELPEPSSGLFFFQQIVRKLLSFQGAFELVCKGMFVCISECIKNL